MLEPIEYKDLVGLKYEPEVNDCYQLMRKYFARLDIGLTDYAFPSDWWMFEDNLYLKHYADEGFEQIVTSDWKPQLHDVMLVCGSTQTYMPTHAGVLCEYNQVLHHYTGRFSEVTSFKSPWRNPAVVLRHKSIILPEIVLKEFSLTELMPRHVREKFERGSNPEAS